MDCRETEAARNMVVQEMALQPWEIAARVACAAASGMVFGAMFGKRRVEGVWNLLIAAAMCAVYMGFGLRLALQIGVGGALLCAGIALTGRDVRAALRMLASGIVGAVFGTGEYAIAVALLALFAGVDRLILNK
ncbi:MAG: hypothetical protein SOR74_02085 [Candidatus Faecivicinus sp.]|nr:hypothetical protein [Candidatus Faecivicinus sp.]